MSTQKQKFELFARLERLGFTYDEAASLRRISMTLSRWGELECGDGNNYGSWAIERDEQTGAPFMVRHHYRHGAGADSITRTRIADREAGALRRLREIMRRHRALWSYYQSDPRGCALYVGRKADLPKMDAAEIARLCGERAARSAARRLRARVSQYYHHGLAVCA